MATEAASVFGLVSSPPAGSAFVPYEKRLSQDSRWALGEGSKYFEGKSAVQETLRKVTARLRELGIDYAVAGGLALFVHGYRRFTEDVDILVTREGLARIHEKLTGLGYLPPFAGSKHLRDAEFGVKVEFLVAGDFPGDGQPKPIAFPNPADVRFELDDVAYIDMPTLVSLKIASGMANAGRLKDLADVQEMIRIRQLPATFVEQLHPFVRCKYLELWQSAQASGTE